MPSAAWLASPALICGHLMPTTWILLTFSFRNLHWSKNSKTALFHHVFKIFAKIYWAFHVPDVLYSFSQGPVLSVFPWFHVLPSNMLPSRQYGFSTVFHTYHFLPLDLPAYLSYHPQSLPSPLCLCDGTYTQDPIQILPCICSHSQLFFPHALSLLWIFIV